jgi:hypothetical protein
MMLNFDGLVKSEFYYVNNENITKMPIFIQHRLMLHYHQKINNTYL